MISESLDMKQNQIDLSIIILNYNTVDWLENTLRSISQYPPKLKQEVIVVDNNSSDDSVEMVRQKFPVVKVIESKENGGFAKGNNIGIQAATGKYIMLLNSDTEFGPSTKLEQCIEFMETHPEVGMISPKLVLNDGSIDLASHRGEPTPKAALTYFLGLEKIFPQSRMFGQYHQTWKNFDTIHEIDACSGAAMIVRADALSKVGLLDERFFMYGEDLDWCKRFREKKYSIIFFPKSVITHHKYKSGLEKEKQPIQVSHFLRIPGFVSPKTPSKTKDHFYETMKQYYSKHYQKSSPITTWIIHKTIDLVRLVKKK